MALKMFLGAVPVVPVPLLCLCGQNLDTMLIKTPDLIEAMIELACSRRWLQTTIYVIEFSQHVLQGLWLENSSLMQVCPSMPAASRGAASRVHMKRDPASGLKVLCLMAYPTAEGPATLFGLLGEHPYALLCFRT